MRNERQALMYKSNDVVSLFYEARCNLLTQIGYRSGKKKKDEQILFFFLLFQSIFLQLKGSNSLTSAQGHSWV